MRKCYSKPLLSIMSRLHSRFERHLPSILRLQATLERLFRALRLWARRPGPSGHFPSQRGPGWSCHFERAALLRQARPAIRLISRPVWLLARLDVVSIGRRGVFGLLTEAPCKARAAILSQLLVLAINFAQAAALGQAPNRGACHARCLETRQASRAIRSHGQPEAC